MEIKILRRILRGLGEDGFLKKYKFIKPLNTGGNSHSYKAYDRSSKQEVFIKFLLLPKHEIEILKFKNEIAIHTLLMDTVDRVHENIVIKYIGSKLFKNDLGGYLILEWLDGKPLDQIIENYSNKRIEDKIQLFHRVINSIIPLSRYIIHRDLHPSNIMVLNEDFEYEQMRSEPYNPRIKIVDFGESYSSDVTIVSDLTINDLKKIFNSNARRLTTSLYATPPEYLKRYSLDQEHIFDKSWNYDCWALGLLGFKIIFNEDAFEHKDIKDYVFSVHSNHFQMDISSKIASYFYSINHDQSKILEHIFHYLLRVNPTQRTDASNVGLVLYLINFHGYKLRQDLNATEYLTFIRDGWYYLDRKGLTRPEHELENYG
ncbi:protein kinase domain-containing protein [Acinetobacter baumannii]|uniref:protein kinase domain-containing protein n=1 Tax=Acinetobacter baumannii TaxID=470 RepID=UPI0014886DF7|nr:protein kinase [Acinetobacter baumannii]EKT8990997.1 protein kinase [Acinetobacter baumannii]EKU0552829.1 protein kinase [Acinetobacter baumannii]EKU0679196.1 protein kinase [Acinetobacter baumannii]EKU0682524.1 protein kinase [Acinetobacter baumannii]EKU0703514.1 protein kinase [Acinetobacter baumannii]